MSEPTTRSPAIEQEAQRIAAEMMKSAHNDYAWREQMALAMARNEAKQDHIFYVLNEHAKKFETIEANSKSVSSAVTQEQLASRYTLKELVIGFLALRGALGAFVGFVAMVIHGGKP